MSAGFEHIGTDCVHAGFDADQQTGAIVPSIGLSTTFKQKGPGIPISVRPNGNITLCLQCLGVRV